MTERLHAVIQAVEKLSPLEQDTLARQMETLLETLLPTSQPNAHVSIDFNAFADLPDDAVDMLDRLRHAAVPTPPYEEP